MDKLPFGRKKEPMVNMYDKQMLNHISDRELDKFSDRMDAVLSGRRGAEAKHNLATLESEMVKRVASGNFPSEEEWIDYRSALKAAGAAETPDALQAHYEKYSNLRKLQAEKQVMRIKEFLKDMDSVPRSLVPSAEEALKTEINRLKAKYPKWEQSLLINALDKTEAQAAQQDIYYGDFPGNDSVEKIMARLKNKFFG